MDILTLKDVYKSFGDKKVLTGMSMSVPEGSVFGFIGKNGSGKTTSMKAILGLLPIDGGSIEVCGETVCYGSTKTNRHIGYLPDVPEYYSFMTPSEYLTFCAEISGMQREDIKKRIDELLALVGLDGEKRRIKGFSRGMKQRLGIASALLARPRLIICDEPTSALDPIGRKEILDVLASVNRESTVLFSTHILSDVERICTHAAFLSGGGIVLQGEMADIKRVGDVASFTVEAHSPDGARQLADNFDGCRFVSDNTVVIKGDGARMLEVLGYAYKMGILIERAERNEANLEALFLEVSAK